MRSSQLVVAILTCLAGAVVMLLWSRPKALPDAITLLTSLALLRHNRQQPVLAFHRLSCQRRQHLHVDEATLR